MTTQSHSEEKKSCIDKLDEIGNNTGQETIETCKHIVEEYIQMCHAVGICPNCSLMTFAYALGLVFKQNTTCSDESIIEMMLKGATSGLGMNLQAIEIRDEAKAE